MQYNITIHTNFAGKFLECAFQWRGGDPPMHSAYIQGGLKNAASLARVKMSIFTR